MTWWTLSHSAWQKWDEMIRTLGEAILRAAEHDEFSVRFWRSLEDSPCLTYGQIAENALKVAGALQDGGLKPGERAAIVLPTGPEFYYAYFGVILAGGVPAPLYPPVRFGRIDEWKARTSAMLTAASAVAVLTELRLVGVLGRPVREAAPRLGCRTVAGLIKEDLSGTPNLGTSSDLGTIQFSSGSTGDPKPVALSHENMLANAGAIIRTFPGRLEEHAGLSWLPLYHDMGLVGNLLVAIVAPGNLTLIGPELFVARPRIWFEAFTHTGATISAAPNFAFGLCSSRIGDDDLEGLDLSSWRLALCGAEPVHKETLERFAKRFACIGFDERALTPVYGLAEATLAVSFSAPDEAPRWTAFDPKVLESESRARQSDNGGRHLCSLGKPLRGVEVAIRDEDGHDLAETRVGNVWVRGPSVMTQYLGRPFHTAAAIRDGWLDTGDLGFLFEGELYLCGRLKDQIIIRGRNYDPAVIEHATDRIRGLRTGCTAAVGFDDPGADTEQLVVLAEKRRDSTGDHETIPDAVAKAIRGSTGLNPDQIILLEPGTLPRTSSGKIRRAEARRRWQAGELDPPSRVGWRLALKENVLGFANQVRAALRRRSKQE